MILCPNTVYQTGGSHVRDFVCEEISPEEFDTFSATHPQGNFQQTMRMANVRRASGVDVSLIGVRENGTLVAATTLELHKSRLSSFAEIHDGPLCDFTDTELTHFLFDELRTRAKAGGAAQLAITPELPYLVRDSQGNELSANPAERPASVPASAPAAPAQAAFDSIISCGFIHSGFDREYTPVPRWRYVKDLSAISDEKALIASYAKNTRRNVRIAQSSFVRVEKATRDDLPTFHAICQLSCEKQGFENRPLEYFQLLYDQLGDVAEYRIAYMDVQKYLASCEKKRDDFAAKIERLEQAIATNAPTEKNRRRLADFQEQYEGSLKRIEAARARLAEDDPNVAIAAALFVYHPRECIYLFSGSNPAYAPYCAADAIQHQVMLDCVRAGVKRYNFYGINGIFDDPSDPGRGLLEFKQGFGGYVEELMGSFTLPTKRATYALKQLAHKVLGR